jgi:GMP synthase-like glutamine amidotransferase
MQQGLVIQTQADAPPGLLDGWAARRGFELRVARADLEELPAYDGYAFAVALGSAETATGSGPEWVAHEIEWLRGADAAGLPVLGICFGAQALAAALGGSVHRLEKPEIGWVSVESRDTDRLLAGPWMAWHEDGFTLPPLAYDLASNAFGVQAFCHCRHLAVQFHPEVTADIVESWRRNDYADLERAGVSAEDIAPGPYAERAARAAEILFDGFAARAGLVAVASRA